MKKEKFPEFLLEELRSIHSEHQIFRFVNRIIWLILVLFSFFLNFDTFSEIIFFLAIPIIVLIISMNNDVSISKRRRYLQKYIFGYYPTESQDKYINYAHRYSKKTGFANYLLIRNESIIWFIFLYIIVTYKYLFF